MWKFLIFFLLICLLVLSSCRYSYNDHFKTVYYNYGSQVKYEYYYEDPGDTSTYELMSYYKNGQLKSKGNIINSKKEGVWEEWYIDGISKGKIEYIEGELNILSDNRKLPELIFSTDSFKVGIKTYIKVINFYPSDGLSCNSIICGLKKRSRYDFYVIPSDVDSIFFDYGCIWCPPEKADTVFIKASEMDDPFKYGLTEMEIEKDVTVAMIKQIMKTVRLAAFPVYKE